jgi:energy-converting hydrogenase A subunit M
MLDRPLTPNEVLKKNKILKTNVYYHSSNVAKTITILLQLEKIDVIFKNMDVSSIS